MDTALDGYKSEVDWRVFAKEQGIAQAKQNWLNHELFAATQHSAATIDTLRDIVETYSGWHWLNQDLQAQTNARELLPTITQPTLLLVGQNDLSYFHNIASVIAAGIPDVQKIVVPDVGHMVNLEAPFVINQHLADFITRL